MIVKPFLYGVGCAIGVVFALGWLMCREAMIAPGTVSS